MQIIIKDYQMQAKTGEEALLQIEEFLTQQNLFLNYICVDGEEVWEDFSTYMEEKGKTASKIEVMALTQQEFLLAYREHLQNQIKELLRDGDGIARIFYSLSDGWKTMDHLVNYLEKLVRLKSEYEQLIVGGLEEVVEKEQLGHLDQILSQLAVAMESKDSIYIADILSFEVLKWLQIFGKKED